MTHVTYHIQKGGGEEGDFKYPLRQALKGRITNNRQSTQSPSLTASRLWGYLGNPGFSAMGTNISETAVRILRQGAIDTCHPCGLILIEGRHCRGFLVCCDFDLVLRCGQSDGFKDGRLGSLLWACVCSFIRVVVSLNCSWLWWCTGGIQNLIQKRLEWHSFSYTRSPHATLRVNYIWFEIEVYGYGMRLQRDSLSRGPTHFLAESV